MRRLALYPLALLYGAVIWLRNRCFDLQLFKTQPIAGKSICVGNLAVGGTGKSPMVEHLLSILSEEYKIATLSRGYKRKTKGYALAGENTTALEIGDEPMQFHLKFQNY